MGKRHTSAAEKLNSNQVDAGISGTDSVTEALRSSRDIAPPP